MVSAMIGLVYTEYDRPDDPRHLAGCLAFELLAAWHPAHVRALTDRDGPGVTKRAFWELCRACDFVFYWGHGSHDGLDGSQLYGTTGGPIVALAALGERLQDRDRILYLDGCQVGRGLDDEQFPYAKVVAPRNMVAYTDSVRMGCGLVKRLFGKPRSSIDDAFTSLRRGRIVQAGPYALIGEGRSTQVNVPPEVAADIRSVFGWIERTWLR